LVGPDDGFAAFGAFTTRLCFVGHSHLPAVWSTGSSGPDYARGGVDLRLEAGRRYIVNVGSVGQPRDRDPRASYVVWDVERRHVSVRRVPYDIGAARAKILAAGLPRFLADRLSVGL
jgi:diadenosine tetraphosphatase ApaH/serine/threonine PP2A family protein phosphatase